MPYFFKLATDYKRNCQMVAVEWFVERLHRGTAFWELEGRASTLSASPFPLAKTPLCSH